MRLSLGGGISSVSRSVIDGGSLAFEFSVNSAGVGTSNNDQFTIPVNAGTFNYDISTDDGYTATGVTGSHTITFPSGAGTHNVVITGTFPGMKFNAGGDDDKILTIDNFGIYGGGSTNQQQAFSGCSLLVINATDEGNFGSVRSFFRFALNATQITTFPFIDMSSSVSFSGFFFGATSLANFPANMFDNSPATNYANAFQGTNLTEQSIDNILVSIDASGTTNGTFKQSGGSGPSATGIAAKDSLVAKGWTVVHTA